MSDIISQQCLPFPTGGFHWGFPKDVYQTPVTVTLSEKRIFTGTIKVRILRWDHPGIARPYMPWCGSLAETKARGRLPETAEPRDAGSYPELGEGEKQIPPEPPEGNNPADTLILDFWAPELWENKFVLLSATRFVVICDSSPTKRIPGTSGNCSLSH